MPEVAIVILLSKNIKKEPSAHKTDLGSKVLLMYFSSIQPKYQLKQKFLVPNVLQFKIEGAKKKNKVGPNAHQILSTLYKAPRLN